ncbi:single-stranded DNA-binding protein A [Andreesenia angusta]|uniref:Single-stranded DNA-binding protein n=1 Tax=Andreesenia angusta TaxID=39480 RepID=A0A1S1V927_9FIRM|nr:single-stranded DNA-binding protein [Andreesenia angusta]OHW63102.1 single-stranded DNA-binding protein A [Andreesenia angusta]
MNVSTIIGRLVRDPELKYLPNGGTSVTRMTVAVDRQMSKEKKQEAEGKGQPTCDFINIVVWGKQGENCSNYLKKGRNVAIQGRIQSGSYTAQDGTKRYTTDVVAERVQFIDWGDKQQSGGTNSGDFNTEGFHLDDSIDEEDVPF